MVAGLPILLDSFARFALQGLLFGSATVLKYGAIVWAGFFLFVVAYEEPALGDQLTGTTDRNRTCI